jgi:hypothetical protein
MSENWGTGSAKAGGTRTLRIRRRGVQAHPRAGGDHIPPALREVTIGVDDARKVGHCDV